MPLFAAVVVVVAGILALRYLPRDGKTVSVSNSDAQDVPEKLETQNTAEVSPTDSENEALIDKALAPMRNRDRYLLSSGVVLTIEDAERVFKSLDHLDFETNAELAVYMPALRTFIERSVAPRDKAQGKYFLAQASLLTRDIAPVMDLLDELASDEQFGLLEPGQQSSVAVSQLALKYLALGGAGRDGFQAESAPLLAPYIEKALAVGGTGRIGFDARDAAVAFGNLVAGKAGLLDEAIVSAILQYDVLRSVFRPASESRTYKEYRDIVHYWPARRPRGDLESLYESTDFQKELASLRQTDPEKALVIEFYALHAFHGIDTHKLVYTRAMELFEELPENHPYRPWFACLAFSVNDAGDSRLKDLESYVRSFVTIQQLRRDEESRVFLRWHWRCE